MAVRIYALAKELDIDSKELVDVCTRAGVPDKGSALASLTEDEVAKVKDFLNGGGGGAATATAAPAKASPPPMQRPSGDNRGGKIRTIQAPKAGRSATRRERDAEAPTPPEVITGDDAETPAEADALPAPTRRPKRRPPRKMPCHPAR